MLIRLFTMNDFDAVTALWARAGLLAGRSDERPEIEKKLERDPDLFLVGVVDDRIVAAVMGSYDGRRGWVNHLAVDPDRHGQGLGAMLLGELECRLQAKGCIKLNLLIEPDNACVEGFYRRLGYAKDPLLFMEKWLA